MPESEQGRPPTTPANRMMSGNDLWDSLFHGCAWAAFADQWVEGGGRPESEETRARAYRYYEEELAEKNRARGPGQGAMPVPQFTGTKAIHTAVPRA